MIGDGIAIGQSAMETGENAVAVGYSAVAYGPDSIAMGRQEPDEGEAGALVPA